MVEEYVPQFGKYGVIQVVSPRPAFRHDVDRTAVAAVQFSYGLSRRNSQSIISVVDTAKYVRMAIVV